MPKVKKSACGRQLVSKVTPQHRRVEAAYPVESVAN